MRINSINNLSFLSLKYHNDGGIKLFDSFFHSVNDPNTPALTTSIERIKKSLYETKFYYDDVNQTISSSRSYILPEYKCMYISNMSTIPEKQQLGLGTGLHLLNVVEMLENKDIKEINLCATPNAIPFHIKFGFYPSSEFYEEIEPNIEVISKDEDSKFRRFAVAAKELLSLPVEDSEKSRIANSLLYEYTKFAILQKRDLQYCFENSVPMVLKKETVLENKDFYNKLFRKYDIDYRIEDKVCQ